jgi:hypothetical protein
MNKKQDDFSLANKLAMNYSKDFKAVMEHYEMEDKIYLTEKLLEVTRLYLLSKNENYQQEASAVFELLLKKYRNKLKPFIMASFPTYYDQMIAIADHNIVSAKEFNDNYKEGLSDAAFHHFLETITRLLSNYRYQFYLESDHPDLDTVMESSSSSELTISRQLLTLYFLLKTLGIEPRSTVDIAPVARFAHLITGTSFHKLQNSNLYKKLKKVPNFKEDKALIKDLEFIIPFFKEINLEKTVLLIEGEIKLAKKN